VTTIVHLTASTFVGGPERQILGLVTSLPPPYRSAVLSFAERGLCRPFLDGVRARGCPALELEHDTPHLLAAWREITGHLRRFGADVLFCHGYKANLLGRLAARRVGIPVAAVSRGWTGENLKLRAYEALDRALLRRMDRVVCVSEGQAVKVRRAGVPAAKTQVIRNSIRAERFEDVSPSYRGQLQGFFASPRRLILGAAGRLSPEKGFAVLLDAAAEVVRSDPSVGFVLFGDGPLRGDLERRADALGLRGMFVLAGFRPDMDCFLPHLDLLILSSYTEGLPNVVLEAFAAGVPVVATAVGGTPEVVEEGVSGHLVPPGNPGQLARRILDVTALGGLRRSMGQKGRERVRSEFTFEAQAAGYRRLIEDLLELRKAPVAMVGVPPSFNL
jgi:glycosyltransferase involved in cell wall biosynthesis